jgi:hypothetical protein
VTVSFIGGGNQSTQREPPAASHWKTLSHNTVSSTPRHERMLCRSLFILYLLVIALSVLLRFTDSVYPFGIFKLGLFRKWNCITHSSYNKQTNRSRFGNKTCWPLCRLVIRLSKKKSWYWIPKFKVHFWCRRKIAKWNLTRKTYMSKRSVYVQFTRLSNIFPW